MSELTNTSKDRSDIRWRLLTTVSALAISLCAASSAQAQEADHPSVWVELGGQLERIDGGQGAFATPFLDPAPPFLTLSPASVQRPARYGFGGEGAFSFAPEGTNWVFSAAVRYGRSNGARTAHQSRYVGRPSACLGTYCLPLTPRFRGAQFANFKTGDKESHTILDFEAGKDVGLGVFGRGGTSQIAAGVRFAQFTSRASLNVDARPDFHYKGAQSALPIYYPIPVFHNYSLTGSSARSFHGVGPSVSWDASAALAGDAEDAHLSFDWGINAALLFGRQKATVQHETKTQYRIEGSKYHDHYYYEHPHRTARTRSIVMPNVGGFAGVSLKFPNAKVSLGYRADFFFGAMDGGIDTRDTRDRNFYGPFASFSIGLGG